MRLAMLCLMLTACGGGIDPNFYPAHCQDTGFNTVSGEMDPEDLDCDNFREFAELSRKMYVQTGLATDDQLTTIRKSTNILIRSVHTWIAQDGLMVAGHNDGQGDIMLGSNLGVLWHEELHSVQIQVQHNFNTGNHPNWKEDGYNGLDQYFRWHTMQIREDLHADEFPEIACGEGLLLPDMVDHLRMIDAEWGDVDSFMKYCTSKLATP